ncbi:FadR/GntR family transcriptional regulator [Marinobacterium sedimentorum]|uniref:FadR/GntR family transcriptional regulator n=1 Tax=Marinobacterium sedimentorum TaxID=2927804 RepID=UPI0020C6CCC6|nr:FadR/GntR family transcriptional regulator [Marinobacterium sedimentorum]MCP8689463.1 FadR family transcriptional regulator [Marinobacterium sedimentorum]
MTSQNNLTTGTDDFQVQRVRQSGSLSSNVASQLENMLSQGKISVGQKLPTENALCDMFGVSRTVIREAITQLKSLGLVETKRGVGTTVLRNSPAETFYAHTINPTAVEDILHILELRLVVETAACELAALRRDDDDMQHIETTMEAFHQARLEHKMARKEDYDFHLSIAAASKNPFFKSFYEQFNKNIIPRTSIVDSNIDQAASEEYLDRIEKEHSDIVAAIKSKNPEAARQAMHQHLYRAYHLYEKYKRNSSFD